MTREKLEFLCLCEHLMCWCLWQRRSCFEEVEFQGCLRASNDGNMIWIKHSINFCIFMMLCDETFPAHSHTFSATDRHILTHFEAWKEKSPKVGMMPFWCIFILEHISTFNVNTRNNILLNFYRSEHWTENRAHWILNGLMNATQSSFSCFPTFRNEMESFAHHFSETILYIL